MPQGSVEYRLNDVCLGMELEQDGELGGRAWLMFEC